MIMASPIAYDDSKSSNFVFDEAHGPSIDNRRGGRSSYCLDANGELTSVPQRSHRPRTLPSPIPNSCHSKPHSVAIQPHLIQNNPNHQNVPGHSQLVNPPRISYFTGQPRQNVSTLLHLGSGSLSRIPGTPQDVAIDINTERPQTSSQVFHNISELAAHYGIPQFLPQAPRTLPRRLSENSGSTNLEFNPLSAPSDPDYPDLCSNYLTMLSQNPGETAVTKDPKDPSQESTAAMDSTHPSNAPDADMLQTLMDVLQATPEQGMSNDFADYLTSPFLDSPEDDLLTTPALGSADMYPDILTSPIIDDYNCPPGLVYPSLFGDVSEAFLCSGHQKSQDEIMPPPELDGLYTISPSTPFLDPSTLESPSAQPIQRTRPSSHRKNAPNGTRKNITAASLVPIDAPTQPRKYVTPSATSKKAIPAIFARKRGRSQAFGEEDELADESSNFSPNMTEQEMIEAKRRQNTIAARRSRMRKLEYQKELEESLERYQQERDLWKSRAVTCQALLRSHGIPAPEFPES